MVGYDKNDTMTANQKLIAGCVSGVVTRFVTQPLDVIKIRTQLQKKAPSAEESTKWFRTSRQILQEEGLTAFWHGHSLGQIHSILAVTSQFYVYELATKYVADTATDKPYKPMTLFICGIFAGCCSATLVLPLEVIRLRQMLVKEQYKGLIKGTKEVYQSGGIFAFYEGLNASLLQMGPAAGLTFGMFGIVQPRILSLFHNCEDENCNHSDDNMHKPESLLIASTIAGSVSGFVSKTMTYPFDLAKRRMQIRTHREDARYHIPSTVKNLARCTQLIECLVKTYRKEGLRGLYRGWKVTVYKAQLTSMVAFTSYELMCYAMRNFVRH